MKKLILAAFALTAAASVFAQGTIYFNDNVSSTSLRIHVYGPLAGNTGFSQIGNGANDALAGTTVWTGFTAVGTTLASGQNTYSSLLAAPGNTSDLSLFQAGLTRPGVTISTFKTGGGAGFNNAVNATFNNILPDYTGGFSWEMVAWDASAAQAGYDLTAWKPTVGKGAFDAWQAGLIAAGVSGIFHSSAPVGGTGAVPNLVGLQSFNLFLVPEPSTFALAGLGAAALLIFRRRK